MEVKLLINEKYTSAGWNTALRAFKATLCSASIQGSDEVSK